MKRISFNSMSFITFLLMMILILMALLAAPAKALDHQLSEVAGPMGCGLEESPCEVFGHAKLSRSTDKVKLGLQTSELEPGAIYTIWWIVFNNPEFCTDPCNSDDTSNPAVDASVLWATGSYVGNDGKGLFHATLREEMAPGEVISGPGLLDAEKAEIHAVLRTHGLPIPGQEEAQLTTLNGGCDVNICSNQQFAVFP